MESPIEKSDLIPLDGHPQRGQDYHLEQLDDEMLLFHPADTKILYLNQTASVIWGLCDGRRSVAEIIQLLSDVYPDEAASIKEDVLTTLRQMSETGCIEWA